MTASNFDTLAAGYDRLFTGTPVGRLQRALIHTYLKDKLSPGATVLELNCGTGEDAVWLAKHGAQVLATDISPEMVAAAAQKARAAGLSGQIETRILDIRSLPLQTPAFRYDLILSNFGGLNCLSPDELRSFSAALPQLLQADGLFIAVVMGRFCWWETFYFLWKRRLSAAFRRFNGGPVSARLDELSTLPVWYYSPAEFRRLFPLLDVKTIQPVGFWLPPSYLDSWFARHPRLLQVLDFLEQKCRGRLWAWGADHFLITFHL